MKYYLWICLLLFSPYNIFSAQHFKVPVYEKNADKLTDQVAKKITRETGLRLCGTGGGMMDNIQMMAMSFDHYGEITVEEARELLLCCVNEYLSAINADEKIRPHLIHYPFTSKDVEIAIFVRDSKDKKIPLDALCVVSSVNGKLVYRNRDSQTKRMKRIHEETFEEAVKLIEVQDPKMKLIKKNKPIPK
jgi:hypothetical protein